MKRSLIPGVAFAATLGLSSLGLAQGNPAAPPPVQSAIGNGPVTTQLRCGEPAGRRSDVNDLGFLPLAVH